MSNDLTATISTKLNGTLGSLDQTQRRLLGLRDTLLAVNRAGKDTAPVLGKALAEVGRRAEQATRAAQSSPRQTPKATPTKGQNAKGTPPPKDRPSGEGSDTARAIQGVGRAFGRAGGGAKQLTKPFEENGLFGAYSRLAVGIGLVTFAYKALAAVEAANIDRLQQQIEYEDKLNDIRKAGLDIRKSAAREGLSSADKERALLAKPGDVARRNALAGEFGIDDATNAVLRARKVGKGRSGDIALQIATALARTGAFSLEEALAEIEQTKVRPTDRNASLVTRRLYRERTGGDFGTDGQEAASRIANDPLQRTVAGIRPFENRSYFEKQQHAIDQGTTSAQAELAKLRNPEAVLMADAFRESQKKLDELGRLAAMESALTKIVANTGMLFGGKGSLTNQLERQEIARGAAWNPTDASIKP